MASNSARDAVLLHHGPELRGRGCGVRGVEAAEAAEEAGAVAGWDYVYDPASGYYYSGSAGHYYDAASGCYWSASTGIWFSYDVDGEEANTTPVRTSECRGAVLQMFG